MNENQIYSASVASRYAICYLRKLRQWREGKIDLSIEGCDPPYMPTLEEIEEDMKLMCEFRDYIDDIPFS